VAASILVSNGVRRRSGAGLLAAALLALTGCQGGGGGAASEPPPLPSQEPSATGAPSTDLRHRAMMLRFHPGEGESEGVARTGFVNSGHAPLRVDVVTYGGGEVTSARAPGGRPAVRFPAFGKTDPGYAILRVVNIGDYDVLRPNEQDFTFGADFVLDEESDGSSSDNGDNLVQRGLYESPSQFKIQVDHGRVSCGVRGMSDDVLVTAKRRVEPGQWYRARCTRQGDTVTLQVDEVGPDGVVGDEPWASEEETAVLGPVILPKDTPLSVGGKLAEDGSMFPASTDQFNGAVARVFYRVIR
jgi:hypothetical protein